MFHGQPYCGACGYEGPDFMWTWHHWYGFGALAQHRESLELRVIDVPDHEVFYRRAGRTDEEVEREREAYVTSVVNGQLRPGERHVPPAEFARLGAEEENGKQPATELPCPRCRSLLLWRDTGIS
jgi:hypothetical protein